MCLHVYPYYKFTVCKLAAADAVCVVFMFAGGLCDRQTVKDEPGYVLHVPTDFKFSRQSVYIDCCK